MEKVQNSKIFMNKIDTNLYFIVETIPKMYVHMKIQGIVSLTQSIIMQAARGMINTQKAYLLIILARGE